MTRQYKSGLEFLNDGPYAERAQDMKEMCQTLADDITTTVVDGETLAYMLMEMYSRGLNDGASAALVQNEEIH